jgi:hypothetical protein
MKKTELSEASDLNLSSFFARAFSPATLNIELSSVKCCTLLNDSYVFTRVIWC